VKQLHNKQHSSSQVDAGAALERLFELAVLLADGMDRELAQRALTRARAGVLWHLSRHGPVTQRALSQALRCSPRNVTGLLDALEAAELVTRDPHPTDRRAVLVSLTEAGSAAVARLLAQRQQAAASLLGDLPGAEVAAFVATLDKVLGRLGSAGPPTDQPE